MAHRTWHTIASVLLWPLTALGLRAEPVPGGYDPSDDVFYQFMPIVWRCSEDRIRAANAGDSTSAIEIRNRFGDFKGMTESLDYLAGLGITAVWMTPIFPSRAYHGYQHGAADVVNPWLGTEEEFRGFIKAAHERRIKVFIDLVAYGISQDSVWFQDVLHNESSPYAPWFAIAPSRKELEPGPVWRPRGTGDPRFFQGYDFKTWTGETIGIAWWDLRREEPRTLVTSWCLKWMDPDGDGDPSDGVDGFRLDHVWGVYQSGPDGWGYNVKDFWIPWKKNLRKLNPRVFTFAEQARWETNGKDLLPAHDAALAKPLLFAIRDSIRDGEAQKASKALIAALREIPEGRTLLGSIGDHDVDRVASSIGGDTSDNIERARLAAAILMALPLPPVLYFGDEIGMLGKAGEFGSDANDIPRREPFKWTARDVVDDPASPMTGYWRPHRGVIERRYSRDNDGRSVEEQQGRGDSLLETYRSLIRLRRENIALRRGDFAPVKLSVDDPAVWCFARLHEKQKMIIAVNFSGEEKTVAFTRKGAWNGAVVGPWAKSSAYKVLGTQSEVNHRITIPARGVTVVEVK